MMELQIKREQTEKNQKTLETCGKYPGKGRDYVRARPLEKFRRGKNERGRKG